MDELDEIMWDLLDLPEYQRKQLAARLILSTLTPLTMAKTCAAAKSDRIGNTDRAENEQ